MPGAIIVLCLVIGASLYLHYLQWRQNEQLLNRLLVRHNYAAIGESEVRSAKSEGPSVANVDDAMSPIFRDNEIKFIVAEKYPELMDIHYEQIMDDFPKEWELAAKEWEHSHRQRVFGN